MKKIAIAILFLSIISIPVVTYSNENNRIETNVEYNNEKPSSQKSSKKKKIIQIKSFTKKKVFEIISNKKLKNKLILKSKKIIKLKRKIGGKVIRIFK